MAELGPGITMGTAAKIVQAFGQSTSTAPSSKHEPPYLAFTIPCARLARHTGRDHSRQTVAWPLACHKGMASCMAPSWPPLRKSCDDLRKTVTTLPRFTSGLCKSPHYANALRGAATANSPPFSCKLLVKLCCLEDTDEHEKVAAPSGANLDDPTLPHRGKDGVLPTGAVAFVPEDIATITIRTVALTVRIVCRCIWPRWEGKACWGAVGW
jgi:hypothetical protein